MTWEERFSQLLRRVGNLERELTKARELAEMVEAQHHRAIVALNAKLGGSGLWPRL